MSGQRTLVTFLNVATRDPKNQDAPLTFSAASYDFGEQKLRKEGLFGLALLGHMIETGKAPDTIAILGTPGSSWGRLMAHVIPGVTDQELAGLDASSSGSGRTTNADLAAWADRLSSALRQRFAAPGLKIAVSVTGYASDEDGQRQLIEHIAAHVSEGGILTIDATHGLRHLPLLAVFSAMALRRIKSVTVDGIYYGARDRSEKDVDGVMRTPVWRLDGLPLIADWSAALSAFDKDGDYGVFAPLLHSAGVDKKLTGNLAEAAFAELIGNFDEAQSRLTNFRKQFMGAPVGGAAALFKAELLARIAWIDDGDVFERMQQMAFAALERGDAVRAATRGFEALVSELTREAGRDPLNARARQKARDNYFESHRRDARKFAAVRLKEMRNGMAHAEFAPLRNDPVRDEVLQLMRKRETCLEALRGYLAALWPDAA